MLAGIRAHQEKQEKEKRGDEEQKSKYEKMEIRKEE